jgi:UDP-N-acetylmuramyl tripeptide synthase
MQRKKLDAMLSKGGKGYDIIESRADAIAETLRHARTGDVVLVSGKGHEEYQITRKGKTFFDDRVEVKKYLGPLENLFQVAASI